MRISAHRWRAAGRLAVATAAIMAGVGLAACSGPGDGDERVPEPDETPTPSPEAIDPRTIDLGEREWTYLTAATRLEPGQQDPPTVTLSGGQALITSEGREGRLELEQDVFYGDLDGDGDEDAIAGVSFSPSLGGDIYQWMASAWYAWLNDGEDLTQLILPIEQAGDCSDAAPTFTRADGAGVEIAQSRFPHGAVCAEGATIDDPHRVEIRYDEDGAPWPVQTDPVLAWGGACPFLDTSSGPTGDVGAVRAAPGLDLAAGVAETIHPYASWLTGDTQAGQASGAVPGWTMYAYITADLGIDRYQCGWVRADE